MTYPMGGTPIAEHLQIAASMVPQTPEEVEASARRFLGGFAETVMGLIHGRRFQNNMRSMVREEVASTPQKVVHKVGLDGYKTVNEYGELPAAVPNRTAMVVCTILGAVIGLAVALLWEAHITTVSMVVNQEFQTVAVQSIVDTWWFKVVLVLVGVIAGRLAGMTFMKITTYQYVKGVSLVVDESAQSTAKLAPVSGTGSNATNN